MPSLKILHSSSDAVEQAFYDAIDHADLHALMDLWTDDDEIICIHPDGVRLIGHEAIRHAWKAIFDKGPVHARPTEIHKVKGADFAVHSAIEQVVVTQTPLQANSPIDPKSIVTIYVTNVYVKSARGWRIALHQASFTPDQPNRASALAVSRHLH